jgi:hypothetical protein
MKWREHLRVIAIVANGLLILLLIGSRGWWWSLGLGLPMITYPLLALIALAVNRRNT